MNIQKRQPVVLVTTVYTYQCNIFVTLMLGHLTLTQWVQGSHIFCITITNTETIYTYVCLKVHKEPVGCIFASFNTAIRLYIMTTDNL